MITPDEYVRLRAAGMRDCVFCDPPDSLVLRRTGEFGVLLDLAPLVPGHLIVHSRQHFGCVGELPADHFADLDEICADLTSLLRSRFGEAMSFEHGRAGHCMSDGREHRLCHHAHVHILPVAVHLDHELGTRYPAVKVARHSDLIDVYDRFGDYLYVQDASGGMTAYPATEVPPHLLRTLTATAIGHPYRADWRAYGNLAFINEALSALVTP